MRKSIFGFLLLGMISCQKNIKNELASVETADEVVLEDIAFEVPKANKNTTITKHEDLLGYWVGNFEAVDQSNGEAVSESDYQYNYRKKLTFSIDQIKGLQIEGHSVVGGNIRPFKGQIQETSTGYSISVKEPGDDKYDGVFDFSIKKNDSIMTGNWNVFNPENTKIDARSAELTKKFFNYNPNAALDYRFIDYEKNKSEKVTYTETDSTGKEYEEAYEESSYFTTSEKVFDINPSTQKVTDKIAQELSKADLMILRNLIFARHGYAFRDKKLRSYFDNFSWYMPVYSDVTKELSAIEKQNIKTFLRFEKNAKEYYDVFGR